MASTELVAAEREMVQFGSLFEEERAAPKPKLPNLKSLLATRLPDRFSGLIALSI
jgi:hypothetical protein